MTVATEIISWLCLVAGGAFSIIGAFGLIRLPDFFTRMHAASIADTLGAGLLIIGLVVQAGFTLIAVKLLFLGLLILFASPAATHALIKAALARGLQPLLAPGDESSKR
jgi:multicomponent Na+:H+ antiporter subunit G